MMHKVATFATLEVGATMGGGGATAALSHEVGQEWAAAAGRSHAGRNGEADL